MEFKYNRSSYNSLKEELNKAKTIEQLNEAKFHIRENLILLENNQLNSLAKLYKEKGGKQDFKEEFLLKEFLNDCDSFTECDDTIYVEDYENDFGELSKGEQIAQVLGNYLDDCIIEGNKVILDYPSGKEIFSINDSGVVNFDNFDEVADKWIKDDLLNYEYNEYLNDRLSDDEWNNLYDNELIGNQEFKTLATIEDLLNSDLSPFYSMSDEDKNEILEQVNSILSDACINCDEDEVEKVDESFNDNFKTVKVTNIEPYYTIEDIDPLVANDLGLTNEEYLENCIEYIKQYIKETLNDPCFIDVPNKYLIGEDEIRDYISDYISDATGYLVDSFDYEIFDEDNVTECNESLNEDLYDDEEININDAHNKDLQQLFNVYINEGKRILPSNSEGVRDMIESSSLNQLSTQQLIDLVNNSDFPLKAKMYRYRNGNSFKLFTTRKWYIQNCIKLNMYKWAVRDSNGFKDELDLDAAINQFKTFTIKLCNKWNDAKDNQYISGYSILLITFPDKNMSIPILHSDPEVRVAFDDINSLSKQETDEARYTYKCLPKDEQNTIKATYDELKGLLKKDANKINPFKSEYVKVEENLNEGTKSPSRNNVRKVAKAIWEMGYSSILNRFIDPSPRGYRIKNWRADEDDLKEIEKRTGIKCTVNNRGDLVIPYSNDTEVWDEPFENDNEEAIQYLDEFVSKLGDFCKKNNIKCSTADYDFPARKYLKLVYNNIEYLLSLDTQGKNRYKYHLSSCKDGEGYRRIEIDSNYHLDSSDTDEAIADIFDAIKKDSKEGDNK